MTFLAPNDDFGPVNGLELIAHQRIFLVASIAVLALILVREYEKLLNDFARMAPRLLMLLEVVGAVALGYVTITMAYQTENEAPQFLMNQITRSTLLLGTTLLVFGVLLLLLPHNELLRPATSFKGRMLGVTLFLVVVLGHAAVVYCMGASLDLVFGQSLADAIGITTAYALVAIFFITVFYHFLVGNVPSITIMRSRMRSLSSHSYLFVYTVLAAILILALCALLAAFFIQDMRNSDDDGAEDGSLVASIVFLALTGALVVLLSWFLLSRRTCCHSHDERQREMENSRHATDDAVLDMSNSSVHIREDLNQPEWDTTDMAPVAETALDQRTLQKQERKEAKLRQQQEKERAKQEKERAKQERKAAAHARTAASSVNHDNIPPPPPPPSALASGSPAPLAMTTMTVSETETDSSSLHPPPPPPAAPAAPAVSRGGAPPPPPPGPAPDLVHSPAPVVAMPVAAPSASPAPVTTTSTTTSPASRPAMTMAEAAAARAQERRSTSSAFGRNTSVPTPPPLDSTLASPATTSSANRTRGAPVSQPPAFPAAAMAAAANARASTETPEPVDPSSFPPPPPALPTDDRATPPASPGPEETPASPAGLAAALAAARRSGQLRSSTGSTAAMPPPAGARSSDSGNTAAAAPEPGSGAVLRGLTRRSSNSTGRKRRHMRGGSAGGSGSASSLGIGTIALAVSKFLSLRDEYDSEEDFDENNRWDYWDEESGTGFSREPTTAGASTIGELATISTAAMVAGADQVTPEEAAEAIASRPPHWQTLLEKEFAHRFLVDSDSVQLNIEPGREGGYLVTISYRASPSTNITKQQFENFVDSTVFDKWPGADNLVISGFTLL
eukprot:m.292485 g.292485  ORF g.292485 m.292485 type:complete len:847 (-) comp12635_c0_seq1:271-2811(-)